MTDVVFLMFKILIIYFLTASMDETMGSMPSQKTLGNYRLGKTLGIGAFGKVKVALHTTTKLKVAIKILDRQSIDDSTADRGMQYCSRTDVSSIMTSYTVVSSRYLFVLFAVYVNVSVKREINILRLFSHPHIVRLYEVIETRTKIYVVMEYMNSGELFDYITENDRLQEDEARHFFQQIISGVECCHVNMVVHRDLKPENLLLDTKRNVKVADFGLSNVMRDGHFLKTSCGSPNYAAPEVISEQLYSGPEVDVWSCGVILFALLCGRLPLMLIVFRSGIYTFPNHLSRAARDLIARILVVDPIKRISIPEIRRHPWFQQHLPKYIALRTIDAIYTTNKVDEEIVQQVVKIGFDINEVIQSLQNRLQNEATVAYHLLLDNHFRIHCSYLKNEFIESLDPNPTDHPEMQMSSLAPMQRQWALGLKSQARPIETMTTVLKVFERLNVKWKKIGPYNMKCLWIPPLAAYPKLTVGNDPAQDHIYSVDPSIMAMNKRAIRSQNAVKFEIQVRLCSERICQKSRGCQEWNEVPGLVELV
ncbi:SNF1-related protein kinase catalytic subunit alpha KIN10 [Vitis vinifera]|uniref:SNF1-related protein kinase catalytic subunit alpha KIN10 n=1 Tax=Vitis vinifera TaxID=29760 RepID=A0A438J7V0_VITVI|nr:SNF1-related protein kinase catalytic subunit alpha KIN10 [Vitis vinifera]